MANVRGSGGRLTIDVGTNLARAQILASAKAQKRATGQVSD